MAITSVGTLGTGIHSTSASSFSFTTSAMIDANNEVLLVVVTDNIVTTDTNSNTHTGVTVNSVAMSKLGEYTNGNGSAGTGVTTSVWRYRPTSNVASGVTVNITLSGNTGDKTCSMWEFTSTNPLMLDATPASNPIYNVSDAATSYGSVAFSGLSSTLRLYFRGLGREANTTTALTTSTNFTTITPQRSRNNASAVMVRGEFRINTSTGETSNPSIGTAGDNSGVFVALVERVTTTKTQTGKGRIQKSVTQTQSGKGKILLTSSVTQNGKAKIVPSFSYYKKVVIDHTKVVNTDQTDFPLTFSGTYPFLKTTGNGGLVQSSNGYDIAFFSDSAFTQMLSFELVNYNATTGDVEFHVKIPTLSSSTNTKIYIGYGNSSISSNLSSTETWNSTYKAVYHFGDGSTLSSLDSTINANNGTNSGGVLSSNGKIGGAGSFDGTDDFISIPRTSSLNITSAWTLQAWTYATVAPSGVGIIADNYTVDGNVQFELGYNIYGAGANSRLSVGYYGGWQFTEDSVDIGLNQWFFITGTWDGTTLRLYKNGVEIANVVTGTNPSAGFDEIFIGRRHDLAASKNYFEGLIDEVRISSNAKSADWIATEYNNQTNPSSFYLVTDVNVISEIDLSNISTVYTTDAHTTNVSANDDPIGAIFDLASGGYYLQSTSGDRPIFKTSGINNVSAMLGDGSSDYVVGSVNGTSLTELTLMTVFVAPSLTTSSLLSWHDANAGNPFIFVRLTGSSLDLYVDGDYRTSTPITTGVTYLLTIRYDGTTWKCQVNNQTEVTYTGGTAYQVNALNLFVLNGFNGTSNTRLGQLKVYSKYLDGADLIAEKAKFNKWFPQVKTTIGVSRITSSSNAIQSGVSSITVTTTKVQTGTARIKPEFFFDDFNDNFISDAWTTYGFTFPSGSITETGQRLKISPPTNVSDFIFLITSDTYNLTDRELIADVENISQEGLSNYLVFGDLFSQNTANIIASQIDGYAPYISTGGVGNSLSWTYVPNVTKLKLRHSSIDSKIYFYVYNSTDTWIFIGSLDITWDVSNVLLGVQSSNWGNPPVITDCYVDNIQTRIASFTVPQTLDGISRVQKTEIATQTGVTRLTNSNLVNQTGVSKIQATTLITQVGKARIQTVFDATINGTSRIEKTVLQTINGTARILQTTVNNQTGLARVQNTISSVQTGLSRVTNSVLANITGVSKIHCTMDIDSCTIDFPVTSYEGILNIHSNSIIGFALRRLRDDYTGYCLRVRRSSDDTEQNIGFDSLGILDWSAATAFASGSDLFVKTWYDQTVNGWDIAQSTNSVQPKLNLTTHRIDFNNSYLVRNSIPFGSRRTYSLFQKARTNTLASTQVISELSANSFVLTAVNSGYFANQEYNFSATNERYGSLSANTTYVLSIILNRDASVLSDMNRFYANGIEQTSVLNNSDNRGIDYSSTANLFIGAYDTSLTYSLDGSVEEFILFTDSKNDTDRQAIEDDISAGLGAILPDGFEHHKAVTIHKELISGDLINFPFLIQGQYSFLRTQANGGDLYSDDGYDIAFFADEDLTTKLPHELVTYDSTTGDVEIHVKVPNLSEDDDTVIYIAYGKDDVITDESDSEDVWNSDYVAVYHLGDGTTLSTNDSTSHNFHGTATGVSAEIGRIGGAAEFIGTNYIDMPTGVSTTLNGTTEITSSYWFKGSDLKHGISIYGVGWWIMGFTGNQTIHYWDGYNYNGAPFLGFDIDPNDGNWHLLTSTWKSNATGGFRTYIDGELVFQRDSANVTLSVGGSTLNRIGYFMYDGTIGLLDEARISNIAKSADWIKTEYNNQSNNTASFSIEGVTIKSIVGKASIQNTTIEQVIGKASILGLVTPYGDSVNPNIDILLTSTIENGIWTTPSDGVFSTGIDNFTKNFQAPTAGSKTIFVRGSYWDSTNVYPEDAFSIGTDDSLVVEAEEDGYVYTEIYINLSGGSSIEFTTPLTNTLSFGLYSNGYSIGQNYYYNFYLYNGNIYLNLVDDFINVGESLPVTYTFGDVIKLEIDSDNYGKLYINNTLEYTTSVPLPDKIYSVYLESYDASVGNVIEAPVLGGNSSYVGAKAVGLVYVIPPFVEQHITGKARIQKTIDVTQTGLGRVIKSVSATINGLSRIYKTTPVTQTGVGRIQNSVVVSQTGTARIIKSVSVIQTGLARINKVVTQTQIGVGRIGSSINQTQLGVARITVYVTKTQTGQGRISISSTATQTGKSRITVHSTAIQTGISRVTKSVFQTQLGLARITTSTTRLQTGVTRVQKSVLQTTTGTARIGSFILQTINGKSAIRNTVSRTQSGIAKISQISSQSITGKAKIILNAVYSRDALGNLPVNNNDLSHIYSTEEIVKTESIDNIRVPVTGSGYLLHQFKIKTPDRTKSAIIVWKGVSNSATTINTAYLQIYNLTSGVWETISNNQTTTAGDQITLSGSQSNNLDSYYDESDFIYIRVYQFVGGDGQYFD